MKLFTIISMCVATLIPTLGLAQAPNYNLSVETTSIEVGETITVAWETDSTNITQDWIGLYRTNASDRTFVSWKYVDNSNGEFSFTIKQPGDYEFRYFLKNGYERTEKSSKFSVIIPDADSGSYELTVDANTYSTKEKIAVAWETSVNTVNQDWIGLYRPDSSDQGFIEWKYVTDTSGTKNFTVDQPGEYEFRYFIKNSYDRVTRSKTFTVESAPKAVLDYELEVSNETINKGERITVSWDTSSTNINRDWVGLFRTGGAARNYLDWGYVNKDSGSFTFTVNQTGTYEFRYYLENGFDLAATSDSFQVGTATDSDSTGGYSLAPNQKSYNRGDTARVTWSVPPNEKFFRNWIGLYRPQDTDRQFIKFEYVDVFSKTETFKLDNDGTYEFRFFTNNTYNKVATSDKIIVSNDDTSSCNLATTNITNFPAGAGPIIAFGDSITFGVGATAGEDYVSELEDRLGVTIRNEGVSGDTTRDALARLKTDVLDRNPSAVIVFLGGNDEIRRFYDRLNNTAIDRALEDELDKLAQDLDYDWMNVPLIPRDETFDNIQTIIERIQATGATTILVGFDAPIYDAQIDDNYRQIARDTESFYVADIYDGVFGRPRFMSDLVHPNDAGYDIVADRIQPAVACVS